MAICLITPEILTCLEHNTIFDIVVIHRKWNANFWSFDFNDLVCISLLRWNELFKYAWMFTRVLTQSVRQLLDTLNNLVKVCTSNVVLSGKWPNVTWFEWRSTWLKELENCFLVLSTSDLVRVRFLNVLTSLDDVLACGCPSFAVLWMISFGEDS
jgi:hypothetical protein